MAPCGGIRNYFPVGTPVRLFLCSNDRVPQIDPQLGFPTRESSLPLPFRAARPAAPLPWPDTGVRGWGDFATPAWWRVVAVRLSFCAGVSPRRRVYRSGSRATPQIGLRPTLHEGPGARGPSNQSRSTPCPVRGPMIHRLRNRRSGAGCKNFSGTRAALPANG